MIAHCKAHQLKDPALTDCSSMWSAARSGNAPCSAPSAAARTFCLPAHSLRNSRGISFSRLLSSTPGQMLMHVRSRLRAASDTCTPHNCLLASQPCTDQSGTHSRSSQHLLADARACLPACYANTCRAYAEQNESRECTTVLQVCVSRTLKCASSMAVISLGTTFSTSVKASGRESTSSWQHTHYTAAQTQQEDSVARDNMTSFTVRWLPPGTSLLLSEARHGRSAGPWAKVA